MDNSYDLYLWSRMRREDALRGQRSDTLSSEQWQSAGSVSEITVREQPA